MPLKAVDALILKPDFRNLRRVLQSSVSPHGRLQLIQSSGGQVTCTSASSRLISTLPINNPVLQLLIQSVQAQLKKFGDGGLYSGILAAMLLEYASDKIEQNVLISQLLRICGTIVQTTLTDRSSTISIPVSLDSVLPLVMVVKSVLFSKPGAFVLPSTSAHSFIDSIAVLLVRGYIATAGSLGKLLVNIHPCCGTSQLLDGLLFSCVDDEHILLQSTEWSHVPVLIITVMLTDQPDPREQKVCGVEKVWDGCGKLEAAQGLLNSAVECGIRLIACQRVVHPSLLLNLRRHGVIVLPRLGRKKVAAMEALSGAIPISSLAPISLNDMSAFKGTIRNVKHMKYLDQNYLFMSGGNDSKILTLSLFAVSSEAASELEVVVHQALTALSHVVDDGIVLPGAGCLEAFLCTRLWQQVQQDEAQLCRDNNCSKRQLAGVVRGLQLALLHAVGLNAVDGSLLVDSIHHHAWKGKDHSVHINENTFCRCGLISMKTILEASGNWKAVCSLSSEPLLGIPYYDSKTFSISLPRMSFDSSVPDIVLDVLSCKLSAFQLALDTCLGISNIGAIIPKEGKAFTNENSF